MKRKPADAVVKALLLGESQDGVPAGLNMPAVSGEQGEGGAGDFALLVLGGG